MSRYLYLLLLFTLAACLYGSQAQDDDEEIKVLKNFGENLFAQLNQFSVFPDKDSEAIHVQHQLDSLVPVQYSRRRRSFSDDNPAEQQHQQQGAEFSDKANLDVIQTFNPNDAFPDLSSDRDEPMPPETNDLISEQITNKSSDTISEMVQKPEQSQNSITRQEPGIDLPTETQGQQQKQPLVKAESNMAVQETIQSQNNINQPGQAAPIQNNGIQQQAVPVQNNVPNQQAAPVQNNLLQQAAPVQNNVPHQQAPPVQNNFQQQAAPVQNNVPYQQVAAIQNNLQQKSAPVQNNVPQQQVAPVQNNLKQPAAPVQNNIPYQQAAPVQNNLPQQAAPVQNNVPQQQAVLVQNNIAQQQVDPIQINLPQQQVVPVQNNVAQQLVPVQNNMSRQVAPVEKSLISQQSGQVPNTRQQQPAAQAENNGLQQLQQQPDWDENSLAKNQQMPGKSNPLSNQQPPPIQAQSNMGPAQASEQNALNQPVLSQTKQSSNILNLGNSNMPTNQQGQSSNIQNALPLNQQNLNPVAKPIDGQRIIDNGGLYAEPHDHHLIDNGGFRADQQKPALINGNDQYVDQSIQIANKSHSPSEFNMIDKLQPAAAHVTGNKPNVKPLWERNEQEVYTTSSRAAIRPGQIVLTTSKVDSSSKAPSFIISTLRNNNVLKGESEQGQDFVKPDDGWYYNQEIDDSLHQGVTESEKHAGKQMLMSAHHFDIPLGAFAGAKMFNNDLWQKNRKQYLMNKKSETFEPMSMALFYSWIALATLAVLAILTVFRHRHKVTGYVYDLRHWHNGGYVEEGRRLLHNAYA